MYDSRRIDINNFPVNGDIRNKIKFLLNFAVLAPSTHNSQPWLFKIENSSCNIYIDPRLRLPEADPKGRDLYISLGCALENLILAAKYYGMFDKVVCEMSNNLIATVYFKGSIFQSNGQDSLLNTITSRINARGLFRDEAIEKKVTDSILELLNKDEYALDNLSINFITSKNKIEEIAQLTAQGLKLAYKKKSFRKEIYKWMNNSLSSKKEGIPGYALRMPFLVSFVLPGVIRFFNIGKKLSKLNYLSLKSAPMIVVITANQENPKIWVHVGRLVERLMLEFNKLKFNTSIFVASIEMGELHKDLQGVLESRKIPQFLFAVGKIDFLHKPTPRHNLEYKLIK